MLPPRAFLAHSKHDKDFVSAVAELLGPHRAVYDEWELESGQRIIDQIPGLLSEGNLFVLFATRHSLESRWVKFETQLVETLSVGHTANNVNVLVLTLSRDQSITVEDLAPWLRERRLGAVRNPYEASYRIARNLQQLDESRFVGRSTEYADLESALIDAGNSHVYCVSGLRGVGRESFAVEAARRFYKLTEKNVTIEIRGGDTLVDLLARLAEPCAQYAGSQELVNVVKAIQAGDAESHVETLLDYLKALAGTKRLLVLRDDGGLLDANRQLVGVVRMVMDVATSSRTAYVALIANWKPAFTAHAECPHLHLPAMTDADMRKLIASLAGDLRVKIDAEAMKALVEYARGHPPAAYNAVHQAVRYGLAVVIADRRGLTYFQFMEMSPVLESARVLDGTRAHILAALLAYSPLPYAVLAGVVNNIGSDDVVEEVKYLQDIGFVALDPNGYYNLYRPLYDAVTTMIGFQHVDHGFVASALKKYVDASMGLEPSVDLFRCLYRAVTYSGVDEQSNLMIGLDRDIEELLEREYEQRNYVKCLELGALLTEQHRAGSFRTNSLLVKAFAQAGEYDEAKKLLERKVTDPVAQACLRSFILRKQGRSGLAVKELERARSLSASGELDMDLSIDLARLRVRRGEYDRALLAIASAEEKAKTEAKTAGQADGEIDVETESMLNPQIIDLKVQIALATGDMAEVDMLMETLATPIERMEYIAFRESDVAYVKGMYSLALEKAREALRVQNPHVTFRAQLIRVQIEMGALYEADKAISDLYDEFPQQHADLRFALRMKLQIKERQFDKALETYERLRDRELVLHRALKRRALEGKLKSLDHSDPLYASTERLMAETRTGDSEMKLV